MKLAKSFGFMFASVVLELIASVIFLIGLVMAVTNILYQNGVNIFHVDWATAVICMSVGVLGWLLVVAVFAFSCFMSFKSKFR